MTTDNMQIPVADSAVRAWFKAIGTKGGRTVTDAKRAALAKLRRRKKQLAKERKAALAATDGMAQARGRV